MSTTTVRLAAKILFSLMTLTGLGFCVAFALEELWERSVRQKGGYATDRREEVALARGKEETMPEAGPDAWREQLARSAEEEAAFADAMLARSEREGELTLEVALDELPVTELEAHFVEMMARDLEDYRALRFAGRILQEIAERDPALGVALLGAMRPAEKERLVSSVARGWTVVDPQAAFRWIEEAWVGADGAYVDRATQNGLYIQAMDTLVAELKDYAVAAQVLERISDPELKRELVDLVAHSIVRDGPETALDRLADTSVATFDDAVLDAVTRQWAARDSVGAADWATANEAEVSRVGVRAIAKYLSLEDWDERLRAFHRELSDGGKRDAVASEAARVRARRAPLDSATWAKAVEHPLAKERAVLDALYEIGYDRFETSAGYIDAAYRMGEEGRASVVYATLRDWLAVDLEAVAGYLGSGRANLSPELSEDLLVALEDVGI